MAQFECEYCGKGFEQGSVYERHLLTSHPRPAPSAADVESALQGVEFPKHRHELVKFAETSDDPEVIALLKALPDREFRDAAEIGMALGELKSHRTIKSRDKPSVKGGKRALESTSAAHLTSTLRGIKFPASAKQLKAHAGPHADEALMGVLDHFTERRYHDMADVAREFGHALERSR